MNLLFLQQINNDIIDETLQNSDKEVLSKLGEEGYPTLEEIQATQAFLHNAIDQNRQARFDAIKTKFNAHKKQDAKERQELIKQKTIDDMLNDILMVMKNSDKNGMPSSLSLAFREQSQEGNEDAIKEIWQSLFELGLIGNHQ